MNISILSTIDKSTDRIKKKVIPLVINSLKDTNHVDYTFRESVISKLQGKGYLSPGENVVMSISLDPKQCGIPLEYCRAECKGCNYNPLTSLLDYYSTDSPFVITCRETIDLLLDSIILLAKANKNALLREKCTAELVLNDFTETF